MCLKAFHYFGSGFGVTSSFLLLIDTGFKQKYNILIYSKTKHIHTQRSGGGVFRCLSNVNPLLKIKTRVCTIVYNIHRHLVAQVMIVVITLNHDI
jgi:hypothetical protein